MTRTMLWGLAVAAGVFVAGLAGEVSPARAAACNCNPFSKGTCGLLPNDPGWYCSAGGCASSGNYTGRCKKSSGGSGNPKSPTESFSAEQRGGAKTAKPRRLRIR